MTAIDLEGQRFGRWIVGTRNWARKGTARGQVYWNCVCDCGNESIVITGDLRNGKSTNCGCGRKDTLKLMMSKHGACARSKRFFRTWTDMMRRCNNPKHRQYYLWGGRGIQVHQPWHDPNVFIDWCFSMNPHPGLTLDRRDNDGDYNPTNCRWISHKEQCNNTRRNRLIEHEGTIYTYATFWEKFGTIGQHTFCTRMIRDRGRDPMKAATDPPASGGRYKESKNKPKEVK